MERDITRWRVGLSAAAVALMACNGSVLLPAKPVPVIVELPPDVPEPAKEEPCLPGPAQPGDSPVRRLTRNEFERTVADLLQDTSNPAARFPAEEVAFGFTNNGHVQTVSDVLIERYEAEAIRLAAAATQDLPKLLGCDLSADKQDGCMKTFISTFGRRAYRRPLADEEVTRLHGFYLASKQADGFDTGVRLTVQAMLQSPSFLYRLEFGAGDKGTTPISGYEMASRLSYLLWSSMPDNALLDAAAKGELDTSAGVAAQARRMLADTRRADPGLQEFFGQWLHLEGVKVVEKQEQLFPTFSAEVRALLRHETELFTTDVARNGKLKDLFSGQHTFMNAALATFYGVPGPQSEAFERVTHASGQRAGLLTQGSLLAAHAKANQTSPVARGYFVLDAMLCAPPLPPPMNANIRVPDLDPTLTTRERFAAHSTQEPCKGCHYQMDPIGFGFEHYDAAGLWRAKENGIDIDAKGTLKGTDVDGAFDGAVALSEKLSGSAQVRKCVVKNWFRFTAGRGDGAPDRCALKALDEVFVAHEGDFKELVIALTQSDMFLYRTNEEVLP